MKKHYLLFVAVAIAATLLGVYLRKPELLSAGKTVDAAQGQQLLNLAAATPTGQAISLKQWQGQVLVINFWATWCPPCREEMPEFSRVQDKLRANSLQIVGIGIDTPDNILTYQKAAPVSYPLLISGYESLKLTATLGNSSMSLPFTVILDKQGNIAHTRQGKLSETELERLVAPMLTSP